MRFTSFLEKLESRSIHLFINCLALGSKPYLTGKEKTWQPKEPPSPLCGSRKGKGEIVTDQIQGQDNGSITSTLCANTLMVSFSLQWKITRTYLPPREMFAFNSLLFTKYFENHA